MLDFYLSEFRLKARSGGLSGFSAKRVEFYYHDSVFTMQIRPILGASYMTDYNALKSGKIVRFKRHNGAEAWGSINKNWGFYASLRDNLASGYKTDPGHLTKEPGANYKPGHDNTWEHSEMRAGLFYENNWIRFGLVKDHIEWGNNYNGANIFTAHAPSVVQINLRICPVKWFELNYLHAWLTSEIIDSSRTYTFTNAYGTRKRYVYHEKYLAANMFTIKPWRSTFFSFGNSIIYSDLGVHPAYLIPFAFYKSIDHTLNGVSNAAGQNSQLFFDFSTRLLPKTHLFATLFVDEIAISEINNPENHSNCISIKTGFRVSNFPLPDLHLTAEYTRSNPLVYQHYTPTTTFESNHFNFGHHLRDNAEEVFLSMIYMPKSQFRFEASYSYGRKGPDYDQLGGRRRGLPFIEEERWRRSMFDFSAGYRFIYNAWAGLGYTYTKTSGADAPLYHPEALLGVRHMFNAQLFLGI